MSEGCKGTRNHPPGVGCSECLDGMSSGTAHALSAMQREEELEAALSTAQEEIARYRAELNTRLEQLGERNRELQEAEDEADRLKAGLKRCVAAVTEATRCGSAGASIIGGIAQEILDADKP